MDKEWGKEQVGRDGKWWVHHAEWYDVTCLLCFCFLQENECGKVDEEVKERWETGRKDGWWWWYGDADVVAPLQGCSDHCHKHNQLMSKRCDAEGIVVAVAAAAAVVVVAVVVVTAVVKVEVAGEVAGGGGKGGEDGNGGGRAGGRGSRGGGGKA